MGSNEITYQMSSGFLSFLTHNFDYFCRLSDFDIT